MSNSTLWYFGIGFAFIAWSWHRDEMGIIVVIQNGAEVTEVRPGKGLPLTASHVLALGLAVAIWPVVLAALIHRGMTSGSDHE